MQSKVKIKPQTAVKPQYPRLMRGKAKHSSGDDALRTIVLFTEYGTGVIVGGMENQNFLGISHSSWDECRFEDFDGIVELSN